MDGNKFLFDRIADGVQATGQSNEYCRGMCNGMLFVKSLIDGAEPKYFERADAGERGENSPDADIEACAYPPNIDELREKLRKCRATVYTQEAGADEYRQLLHDRAPRGK